MDIKNILDTAKQFAGEKKQEEIFDDLLIDRFHNRYTVAILVCFCIALSTYQYIGDPIKCWIPAQLADNYEDYIDRLCYIQNTYHVPKHLSIPQDYNLRRERTLKYYQWIHFVLLLQALFFTLPRILWQSFNDQIGLPIRNLIDAANRYQFFNIDTNRSSIIQYIADCLQRYEEFINPSKRNHSRCRAFYQGRTGASLTCFYILIKFLYIINVIFQMIFLQYFLSYHDVNYLRYGWNMFEKFFSNSFLLPESQLFPRMTLCDFQVRELGEQHFYTVECILTINIFIEKMYFLLWIWFGLLFLMTIIDLVRLLYRLFYRHCRNVFIRENLELILRSHLQKDKQFAHFLRYFPIDNVFTLRIIASNASSLIVAEILQELFERQLKPNSDV